MKLLRRFSLELALLAALAAAGTLSWSVVGFTSLEGRKGRELALTPREQLGLKRSWFFGHSEVADLFTALSVVATTVDLFTLPQGTDHRGTKLWARFENAINEVRFLSRFAIGMHELYQFPASYLLFDDENPQAAMEILQLGLRDERTGSQIPLFAAFISHVFLRNPVQAAEFYELLYTKHKAPEWVKDLAQKLKSGQDPIDADTPARRYVLKIVRESFPRAREFFERNQKLREQEKRP